MSAILRFLGTWAVRIFYRRIVVAGLEHVPAQGPVVVVANHPNGLVDPVLIRIALSRPVAMLAKSTLFGNALGRAAMRAFGAMPVWRSMDAEDTARNAETFERCRELLSGGGWLALFPEGTSHSDPEMRPLKTGAARIALGAEEAASSRPGVRIVPIGLCYEDKARFRSRVTVRIGQPLSVPPRADPNDAEDPARVRQVTADIDRALGDVVLEANSRELWRGFLAVAAWTAPDGGRDLAAREARARRLAGTYRELAARDPDRAESIVEDVRRFARRLNAVGVADPFLLEAEPRPGFVVRSLLSLLLSPLALLGALLGWVPYRLVRPLARRLAAGHHDLVSTYKVLLGVVVLLITYLAEAIIAGWWWGWPWGMALLIVAPALGLVAVRVGEKIRLRREAVSAWWLRAGEAAREIRDRRRELCDLVEAALVDRPLDGPRGTA